MTTEIESLACAGKAYTRAKPVGRWGAAQAPHRGRVRDLVRRQGEGGDRRRGVGELVDLAGGEQYKERRAGNNAQDPPSWGQGPAQTATSPGAPHDLALVP